MPQRGKTLTVRVQATLKNVRPAIPLVLGAATAAAILFLITQVHWPLTTKSVETAFYQDSNTGIPIKRYFVQNVDIHIGYTNNSPYLESNVFFFMGDYQHGLNLYLYSPQEIAPITTRTDKDVYDDVNSFGLTPVALEKKLYYSIDSEIYEYDTQTKKTRLVTSFPEGETVWAPLHGTKNGKYLSTTVTRGDTSYITRIDTQTGSATYLESPFLNTEDPIANHAQVNPRKSNFVMFAHEGSWIRDRIWIWNVVNDKARSLWKQPEYTEVGHEIWSPDGEKIYAVQYGSPQRGIPSGIITLTTDGDVKEEVLSTKYYLSDLALSPDENFAVADTSRPDDNGNYWIVLYDLKKKRFIKVTTVDWGVHPAHPHPSWSRNGEKIIFNDLRNGKIEIQEVLLSDILKSVDSSSAN